MTDHDRPLNAPPCERCGGSMRYPVLAGKDDPAHEGAPLIHSYLEKDGKLWEASRTEQTLCEQCGYWRTVTTQTWKDGKKVTP